MSFAPPSAGGLVQTGLLLPGLLAERVPVAGDLSAADDALAETGRRIYQQERKVMAEQKKRSTDQELQKVAEGKRFLEENAKRPGVVTTESGLQFQIVEAGTGKTPGPTDQVTVNYRGTQVNGQEFDSSYSRGKPASFQLSGVVKGWTEGLQLIKERGKIQLFIPSKLAYGDRGPLAHRTLIFDVELISVGAEPASPAGEPAHPKAEQ